MKLYNSLSRSIELFRPQEGENNGIVTVYVCGITPYDTTHLGHLFTYTVADILIRYMEYKGLRVKYVQNVTDIDDDILRKAKEVGEDWQTLGNRWTAYFIRDMQTLNVRPPDHFPRATDVISEIIATVESLLDAEVAYENNGNVYFDVNGWPDYGKLSHLSDEEMLPVANERGNNPDDSNKHNPLDFILWLAQSPGEPAWDSPWGPGRPGWHIECSTMASKFLGETIDIHSGGHDLLFPHHESEIAQVEPITNKEPFVRLWMHAAMVRHEGEKMSKSLGNLVMARDLLEEVSPDALRLYLGMHHYQIEWSCDRGRLRWAERLAQRIKSAVSAASGAGPALDFRPLQNEFEEAMDNNLDTPTAMGALDDLAVQILVAAQSGQDVSKAQESLKAMGKVFGLRMEAEEPDSRVLEGWGNHLKRFTEK